MELKSRFSTDTAHKAHQGTLLASAVPPQGMSAPYDHAWGYPDSPGEMGYHIHSREELYFFFRGEGFVRIDVEEIPVFPAMGCAFRPTLCTP